jgi:hypothetical protein
VTLRAGNGRLRDSGRCLVRTDFNCERHHDVRAAVSSPVSVLVFGRVTFVLASATWTRGKNAIELQAVKRLTVEQVSRLANHNGRKFGQSIDMVLVRSNTLARSSTLTYISTFQVVAGILASVDDDELVTDESWKCTTRFTVSWMSPSFDDNSWPAAAIAGTNSASDIHKVLADIDPKAKWIWTKNNAEPTIDSTVYCRGYLGEKLLM